MRGFRFVGCILAVLIGLGACARDDEDGMRAMLNQWFFLGDLEYFSVFNDHLTDGSHPEAPYNKLASDHGQIMAHIKLIDVG